MPEYEVRIKFHFFPYKKFTIIAPDEEEAKKTANDQAEHFIENINFSIAGITRKSLSIDDFLKEDTSSE